MLSGIMTEVSTLYTLPTSPTSPTASPANSNRLQKSSEAAAIAGPVIAFVSLAVTLGLAIHKRKQKQKKERRNI
jgi:hypothetical protein